MHRLDPDHNDQHCHAIHSFVGGGGGDTQIHEHACAGDGHAAKLKNLSVKDRSSKAAKIRLQNRKPINKQESAKAKRRLAAAISLLHRLTAAHLE